MVHEQKKNERGVEQMTEYIPLICTVVGCVIGVAGFFIGQKKGLATNSYEQGLKDANIASELKAINTKLDEVIKNTISQKEFAEYKQLIATTLADTVSQKDFMELLQKFAVMEQKVIALEKNVFKKGGGDND